MDVSSFQSMPTLMRNISDEANPSNFISGSTKYQTGQSGPKTGTNITFNLAGACHSNVHVP